MSNCAHAGLINGCSGSAAVDATSHRPRHIGPTNSAHETTCRGHPAPIPTLHPPLILLDIDDWERRPGDINHYAGPWLIFLAWREEWGIRRTPMPSLRPAPGSRRAAAYAPHTPRLYLPNGVSAARPVRFQKT
ncbi:MAG: hypothetical protein R2911_07280 [Caldilineaceae bacterium]